ncbi:MAG: hydroxymethylpyrimidine/phosphomethylpyrimidine kinase [Lentisphaeria bacterium]|nr:hydroxymethylpyrimidine/phosphomethylpyrimidine kinase [Lentisphaeria bacterium]
MAKKAKIKFYPAAMTVSGSDSGGGSGIAADLRTFNALGVFGTCAVTAIAARNPAAVLRTEVLDAGMVTDQIEAVCSKLAVKYVKTGMLFSADMVHAVIEAVKKYQLTCVCDPVIYYPGSRELLPEDTIGMIRDELLCQAAWITPGIAEAELFTGKQIKSLADMFCAAEELSEKYSASVWLKGGRLPAGSMTADVIVRSGRKYTLRAPEQELLPYASYGMDCTLSAALTAMLVLELPWKQAVCAVKAFVFGSQMQTVELGPGVNAMYPPADDFSQLIKLEEQDR